MKEKDAANAESQGKSTPVEHKTPSWAERKQIANWARKRQKQVFFNLF